MEKVQRHRKFAEDVLVHETRKLTWTDEAVIYRGGGSTVPIGRLVNSGRYAGSDEIKGYTAMIPDWHRSELALFPSEEGVAIWRVFEGTAADNARSRSLGLAGKKIRVEAADIWFLNERLQVWKHVQEIPRIEAAIALCIGTEAAAGINSGASAEAYVEAVERFKTTGRFVDPDQPAVAMKPIAAWLVEGKSVPMPLGRTE